VRKSFYAYVMLGFSLLLLSQITIGISAANIIKNPYLSNVTLTSIVISWETDSDSNSVIEYASDNKYAASGGAYDQKVEVAGNVKRHSLTLKDLVPSALYHYKVTSGADTSQDTTFHTAVRPTEPYIVDVYGDTRTNPGDHLSVIKKMIESKPNIVLHSGDLVESGSNLALWDIYFSTIRDLAKNVPYYTTLGNHEGNSQNYYDLLYLPSGGGQDNEQWYSFDYGNSHIISLDSNIRYNADQLKWLENDLAQSADKFQWIFVFFHNPPYSSSSHGSEFATLTDWIKLFEKYGVDMVFNGHDHVYERSVNNGIQYVIAGSGGAPQYDVNIKPNPNQIYAEKTLHFCKLSIDGASLIFEMIRPDGSIGDTFSEIESTAVTVSDKLSITWGKIKSTF
jgi:acid phosphatase type 7